MHQMDGPTRGAFLHLATVALWLTSQSRHRSMVQGGSSNQALRKTLLCWQTSPFSKAEAQKRACKLLSENDARSGCEEWRRPTDGPGPESMTSTKSKPLLEFRVHVCVCVWYLHHIIFDSRALSPFWEPYTSRQSYYLCQYQEKNVKML